MLFESLSILCVYNNSRISFYTLILAFRFLHRSHFVLPIIFDYGLEINKEYLVMGIMTFKKSDNLYFLIDEDSRPGWFPHQIFEIESNELPFNWFVRINKDNKHTDYRNLIGFAELCNDEDFFNKLLERDEATLRTYFRRKMELEKEWDDINYVINSLLVGK